MRTQSSHERRAVFLDRDGVINRMVVHPEFGTVDSPANPAELDLLPGVPEAIATINCLGLLAIVVSNQPGVAKGRFSKELLVAMQQKMERNIALGGGHLDGVYYCLHHPRARVLHLRASCECRKPRPGLLIQASHELGISLRRSYVVGDGVMDVAAGSAAGATTIFVSPRKCYICAVLEEEKIQPDYVVADLPEAADLVKNLEMGNVTAAQRFVWGCTEGRRQRQ